MKSHCISVVQAQRMEEYMKHRLEIGQDEEFSLFVMDGGLEDAESMDDGETE